MSSVTAMQIAIPINVFFSGCRLEILQARRAGQGASQHQEGRLTAGGPAWEAVLAEPPQPGLT